MKRNSALGASRSGQDGNGATGVVVLLAAIAALYYTRAILIPLAFALTLTFLLAPAVTLVQRLRVSRVVAVLVTVIAGLGSAGGVTWFIGNQFVDIANQLPQYRDNIHAKIAALHVPATGSLGKAAHSVQDVLSELSSPPAAEPGAAKKPAVSPAPPVPVRVVPAPENQWTELRNLGAPILGPLGRAGMVLIFTIFMLMKREDLRNRLLRLAGLSQLNLMTQALDDASARVSRYLLMQSLVNLGFGATFAFGLYLIGVPYAALWGAIAGILRIVPYVGTMVAATLPVTLSLAVFDGWHKPLLVFLVFAGIELIVGNAIEPCLYGAHVGISSLGLLVTSVFWAVLWGPAGLILSTPLTVCVVVLGRYVPQFSFLHVLLGDEPVLAAEAQIYQRLLAMDQAEAQSIVAEFLKTKPIAQLYDEVLIPALSLAEQDRHKGAIDTAREEFLFLSVNEMIAEFSGCEAEGNSEAGRGNHRIICLPAHDHADEIVGAMLAQLLEREGFATMCLPGGGTSPEELLRSIEAGPHDILCISALPPYAFAPARNICKQIRERFPQVTVVVCVWGFSGDPVKAKLRFERTEPECLCVTLADAIEKIQQLDRAKPLRGGPRSRVNDLIPG